MGDMVKVGKVDELADGTMKSVSTERGDILLARVGDRYYAANNQCPHMKGKLAEGTLEGTLVTCPLHGSQFDLRDGKMVRWMRGTGVLSRVSRTFQSSQKIPTYRVEIENGNILVGL
jgi:3-phenylpropionate/trans-cinnamate dioxygenase ferredoxin subunit